MSAGQYLFSVSVHLLSAAGPSTNTATDELVGLLTNSPKLEEAVVAFVTAILGWLTARIVKGTKRDASSAKPIPPGNEDDQPLQDARPREIVAGGSVPLEEYNRLRGEYDRLYSVAVKIKGQKDKLLAYAKDLERYVLGLGTRAEELRLNSRALRAAIYFAVANLLVVLLYLFSPSAVSLQGGLRDVMYVVLTFICAFAIPAWLTWDFWKNVPRGVEEAPHRIAFRVGFVGLVAAGIISMGISLPFNWARLQAMQSPIAHVGLAMYILVLRIVLFPALGYFGSLLVAVSRQPQRPGS